MIYFLFWWIVFTTITSTIFGFYNVAKNNKSVGDKVAGNIGVTGRLLTFLYFLYIVYPALQYVQ